MKLLIASVTLIFSLFSYPDAFNSYNCSMPKGSDEVSDMIKKAEKKANEVESKIRQAEAALIKIETLIEYNPAPSNQSDVEIERIKSERKMAKDLNNAKVKMAKIKSKNMNRFLKEGRWYYKNGENKLASQLVAKALEEGEEAELLADGVICQANGTC